MIQSILHLVKCVTKIILMTLFLASCANNPAPAPTATVEVETPVPATPTSVPNFPVQVWLTTRDQSSLLEPQPDIVFTPEVVEGGKTIFVNENHHYQQMDGFGASMTDASAWLIYTQLSAEQRAQVMATLFSPTEGIGVSITRIPI